MISYIVPFLALAQLHNICFEGGAVQSYNPNDISIQLPSADITESCLTLRKESPMIIDAGSCDHEWQGICQVGPMHNGM